MIHEHHVLPWVSCGVIQFEDWRPRGHRHVLHNYGHWVDQAGQSRRSVWWMIRCDWRRSLAISPLPLFSSSPSSSSSSESDADNNDDDGAWRWSSQRSGCCCSIFARLSPRDVSRISLLIPTSLVPFVLRRSRSRIKGVCELFQESVMDVHRVEVCTVKQGFRVGFRFIR